MADDRSASMLELMAIDAPQRPLRRGGPRWRTRRADDRDSAQARAPRDARAGHRQAHRAGARGGVQGGRVERRDRRLLLPRDDRHARPPREVPAAQARAAVLHARGRQLRHHQARRVLHARVTSTRSPIRSTAGGSRTSCSGAPARPAPTRSAAGACRTSSLGADTAHDPHVPGGRGVHRHRALGRRRDRAREHPAPQARRGRGRRHRPPLQRRVDPARRRTGLRGLDRRRGVARPDAREGPADPLDLAPDPARVLAVADPARVGADLDRRVRRPALPPVGGDLELRRVDGLDEAQRAQLHAAIDERRADVLDFLRVQDYSYGSTRFFSGADRWTLGRRGGGVPGRAVLAGL